MNIKTPYILFLGDAADYKQAKVACGVSEWRPELCISQLQLSADTIDLGLPNLTIPDAKAKGAKTLLIGVSPYTTELPQEYVDTILEAITNGLDIANPLHSPLPQSCIDAANEHSVQIHNFRHRPNNYPKGNGEPRTGLRLLTVGTDCAIGKKFTALTISRALTKANVRNTFRSTGQTGFIISNSGINNDTIEADFLSGAAEWLTPENENDHWDIVEGQGALSHPSFGAGSLSLIYGTQPDLIVMCTEPNRKTQRGVRREPKPLKDEISDVLHFAKRTNPNARLGAISVMTRALDLDQAKATLENLSRQYNVPVFDPARPEANTTAPCLQDLIQTMKDMANGET